MLCVDGLSERYSKGPTGAFYRGIVGFLSRLRSFGTPTYVSGTLSTGPMGKVDLRNPLGPGGGFSEISEISRKTR